MKASQQDTLINEIKKDIVWLENNLKSDNIVLISRTIDHLTIKAASLGGLVSEAYRVMNENEDDYKISLAEFVSEYDGSAAKGEREGEVKYADKKKAWTEAKNVYKRLDMILDRIDKICDSHRQKISVIKLEVKGI